MQNAVEKKKIISLWNKTLPRLTIHISTQSSSASCWWIFIVVEKMRHLIHVSCGPLAVFAFGRNIIWIAARRMAGVTT